MPKHLQRDLEHLHRSVLQLAGHVEDAVATATAALTTRDPDLARPVIDGDGRIDHLENAVQEECLKILARHQPVAVDLRRISTVLMITTDLERIGDLAVGIAERVGTLARSPRLAIPAQFERMAGHALWMVRASLDAFVNEDPEAACRVIRADFPDHPDTLTPEPVEFAPPPDPDLPDVERDTIELVRFLVTEMKRSAELIEPALALFTAVRHLERIADHATNIAEDVIYLVNGDMVRHHTWAIRQG